jgi:hypothetical protein
MTYEMETLPLHTYNETKATIICTHHFFSISPYSYAVAMLSRDDYTA